jgi:hypothetical protein
MTKLKPAIKQLIKATGFEVRKVQNSATRSNPYALGYVSAQETIHAASKNQLSVVDYLEKIWDEQGNSQKIIDTLKEFGVFNRNIENICEIGTGAGLYVEKTIEACQPARYESYEPDRDWAKWLAMKHTITSHDADGKSLSHTQPASIDLVTAHGVFVYLPFLVTYRYFQEIVRVINDTGYIAFDILSEDCLDDETVTSWLKSEQLFPCFLAKDYVVDFFAQRNFLFVGEFFNTKFNIGKSKYLIFQKKSSLASALSL